MNKLENIKDDIYGFIYEQKKQLKGTEVLYLVLEILNNYDEYELMETRQDMTNFINDVVKDFLRKRY